jgi:hypothetical protein
MKRSVVWMAVGAGVIGIGVPAYAASQGSTPRPSIITVEDSTSSSVDDDATENSVEDDATDDSVGDVSGKCDEAEHADDPECTGAAAAGTVANNSGPGSTEQDNSGPGNADDSGHHNGGDDGGTGGNDD